MEHHFKQAVFDTLRLLQILTHDADIANNANLTSIYENGRLEFTDIIDGNMDRFDLEQEKVQALVPQESEIVQRVATLYLNGLSYQKISGTLNHDGIMFSAKAPSLHQD